MPPLLPPTPGPSPRPWLSFHFQTLSPPDGSLRAALLPLHTPALMNPLSCLQSPPVRMSQFFSHPTSQKFCFPKYSIRSCQLMLFSEHVHSILSLNLSFILHLALLLSPLPHPPHLTCNERRPNSPRNRLQLHIALYCPEFSSSRLQ